MKARELAEFLMQHPDRDIQVSTPEAVWIVNGADLDQFPGEGPCVVLTVEEDDEEE